MMSKHSSFLKWTTNKNAGKTHHRKWIHPAEALQSGHVAYVVKFLGMTDANQPKGIEVVKESIQKLKFNNQPKLSDGTKMPKVELTVSVDGVAVQNSKSKQIFYQYPLHQISYCADDKSDKKLFCFIAKEPNSDRHSSFVFASDKLAEEITLTIGQAFDLAYRRFLETSGKELEMRRRIMLLQKKVQDLEAENKKLNEQVVTLQKNKTIDSKVEVLKSSPEVKNSDGLPPPIQPPPSYHRQGRNNLQQDLLGEFEEEPKIKNKYNEFFEDIKELENTYNGNSAYSQPWNNNSFESQLNAAHDPFGMGNFGSVQEEDLRIAIGEVDRRLSEMRDGFKRGLSFGNDDFSSEFLGINSK